VIFNTTVRQMTEMFQLNMTEMFQRKKNRQGYVSAILKSRWKS